MNSFIVIDNETGKYPNCEKIALQEEWAKHLVYCDIDTFAITEDGNLILLDDCGNCAFCPADRFTVVFEKGMSVMAEKYDFSNMFMNAEIKPVPNLQAELLPCPFCGETPNIAQYKDRYCIQCLSTNCFILPQTALCNSEEEAVKKWNTRTPKERGGEK